MSFKDDVQPIFKLYCTSCHSAPDGEGYKASGLDLTTYQGVMKGTKYGPMIVPGNAEYSNLMWLLDWRASPQLRMPHGKKQLPAGERDLDSRLDQPGRQGQLMLPAGPHHAAAPPADCGIIHPRPQGRCRSSWRHRFSLRCAA